MLATLLLATGLFQEPPGQATESLAVSVGKALERAVTIARSAEPDEDKLSRCLAGLLSDAAGSPKPEQSIQAALLALGYLTDPTDSLRKALPFRATLLNLETEAQRLMTRKVGATLKLVERSDLAAHFFVAASLERMLGAGPARSMGIAKEIRDAAGLDKQQGTGFSFADLCANEAGIGFSEYLRKHPKQLKDPAAWQLGRFMPYVDGLPEGLTTQQLNEQYGGVQGDRFLGKLRVLQGRVAACAAFRKSKPPQ